MLDKYNLQDPDVRGPSIFRRLLGAVAVVFLVGGGFLGVGVRNYAHIAADEAYDRLLVGSALQFAEAISIQEDAPPTVDLPLSAFDNLSLAPRDRVFYRLIGPSGVTMTGDDDLARPAGATAQRLASGPLLVDDKFRNTSVRLIALGRYLSDASPPGWQ